MLKERAHLAAELWADAFTAFYMHPRSLVLSDIRAYCKELGVRWLVVFRSREFKATSLVQVKDMQAPSGAEREAHSHGKAGKGNVSSEVSVWQVDPKDL